MKSMFVLTFILAGGTLACNRNSTESLSSTKAVVDTSAKPRLSQDQIESIANLLRKAEGKDQLLEAEASLKAGGYSENEAGWHDDENLNSDHYLLKNSTGEKSARVISLSFFKGRNSVDSSQTSAKIFCIYFENKEGKLVIDRVLVEYSGKTWTL